MSLEIEAVVLERTTDCERGFACLEGGKGVCEVTQVIPGDGVFVSNGNASSPCPYLMSFGYSCICLCPTRYELYRRHGV